MRLIARRRWASLSAVTALAVAGAIAPGVSASAAEPDDSGVVAASGYVTLNPFPSDSGLVPNLNNVKPGSADLCVDGVVVDDSLSPYVYADGVENPLTGLCVGLGGPSLHAAFNYYEPCVGAVGLAAGSLSFSKPDVLGAGPPVDSDGDASESFFWVRVGLSAVLVVNDVGFSLPQPTVGELSNVDGGAVAVFAPVPPVPNCVQGAGALKAYVVAAGAWA